MQLLVFLLACVTLVLAQDVVTPEMIDTEKEVWYNFNGRSFCFIPTVLTWAEAERNCRSMKANLASVHNLVDFEFIHDLVCLVSGSSPRTWIGGSDCQQESIWLWSDGSDFQFTLWSPGQPNNQNNNQSCIQINNGDEEMWDDTCCSSLLPSVCVKTL